MCVCVCACLSVCVRECVCACRWLRLAVRWSSSAVMYGCVSWRWPARPLPLTQPVTSSTPDHPSPRHCHTRTHPTKRPCVAVTLCVVSRWWRRVVTVCENTLHMLTAPTACTLFNTLLEQSARFLHGGTFA